MTSIDEALAHLRQGNLAAEVMPAVDAVISQNEHSIQSKMFRRLQDKGGLSPEEALQAWIELHSLHKMRKSLTQLIASGQDASRDLQPMMEEKHGES